MIKKRLLTAIMVLLPTGLLIAYLTQHIEMREVSTPIPLRGEAARNSLYAAELFLQAMGFRTERHLTKQLDTELPPASAAIVIDGDHDTVNEATLAALLDWVNQGGKLLLRPNLNHLDVQTGRFDDKLLDRLGISARHLRNGDREASGEIRISRPEGDLYLEVRFDERFALEGDRPGDVLMLDNNGVHLIRRTLGHGSVSILSDLDFIGNIKIGERNHAGLLWQLLNWDGTAPTRIWLIHSEAAPSLPRLLWRHAQPVVLIAGLWLLLFLLTAGHRFGPMRAAVSQPRRSLMEHIEASGRWYWEHGQQGRLLESSRRMVLRKMNQLHPQWTNLSEEERHRYLATHVQWPVSRVGLLFESAAPTDRESFARMIEELETLRTLL